MKHLIKQRNTIGFTTREKPEITPDKPLNTIELLGIGIVIGAGLLVLCYSAVIIAWGMMI